MQNENKEIKKSYIEKNIKAEKIHNPKTFGYSFKNCSDFVCVECGKPVSPAVVRYFDGEPLNIKCYNCQNN